MDPRDPTAPSDTEAPRNARRPAVSRAVLEGVRRRDREALGEFFECYADHLFGLAFRLLGNREQAEDAIQEVFLKVHRAADRLDPERDPGPWLVTITYNVCRGHWRSWASKLGKRSHSIEGSPALASTLRSEGRDAETQVLATEMEDRLTRAIGRLPEAMRAVVLLHDYRELTHEQVGEIVGASAAAVRKRYSRALALLRQLLEESET